MSPSSRRTKVSLGLLLALFTLTAPNLAAQGLTARIAPEFSSIRWNDDVGLSDANFYGGAAALGFGRYVLLRTSYRTASTVATSFGTSSYNGAGVVDNSLDASLFSTDVQLRLGAGRFAPVVLGGGGVMSLSPNGRESVRQVLASYGAGIDGRILPWLDGQVLVQNVQVRLDRAALADASGGAPPADPQSGNLSRSLALSASLGARVGGGRRSVAADRLDMDVGQAFSGGEGLMIPVEVNAGVVRFSDALAIPNQSLAGVRAGFDFGPYFGLRGSYARGFSSGSFAGMSNWSGEAQFNVGQGTGFAPYLLVGYGGLTFWGDFMDDNAARPQDERALIVGGGIGIPITERSRLVVSLRDYVTSAGSASTVSTPSDLRHSFGLSTGLSFDLRGRRQTLTGAVTPPVFLPPTEVAPESPPAAPETPAQTAASVNYQGERISIPVPIEGELYIRYGPPSASTPVATAGSVAPYVILPQFQTESAAIAATGPEGQNAATRSDLALLEDRIAGRIAATLETMQQTRQADSVVTAAANGAPVVDSANAAVTGGGALVVDSANMVTRADLVEMEDRIANRIAASLAGIGSVPDSAGLAALIRSEMNQTDTVPRLTRDDLLRVEEQLAARFVEIMDTRSAQQPANATATSPEVTALAIRVDELARVLRENERRNPAGPATITVVPTGLTTDVAVPGRGPLFRGVDVLLGSSSARDSGLGVGGRVDIMVGEAMGGTLKPYLGMQFARSGVRGTLAGTSFSGNVTSIGVGAGLSASLPRVKSVHPELSLGLVGLSGGVSGDTPEEADVVERVYGGFVMGPRIAIDALWRQNQGGNWVVATSLARTWASARGGWSLQVGLRWERPFTRTPATFRQTSLQPVQSPAFPQAGVPAAETGQTVRPVATSERAAEGAAPASPADSVNVRRITELEGALATERQARQAAEAAADSVVQAGQRASARADSVTAEAERTTQLQQRAASEAASRRAALRTELENLVGVLDDVQDVHETTRGLEIVIGGGVFPTGRVTLEGPARARVLRVARILARHPGLTLLVDGHTDSTGSDETNRSVSQARAEAIRSVLIGAGIRSADIALLASGENTPIAPNDTPAGRAENRRVEIVIVAF